MRTLFAVLGSLLLVGLPAAAGRLSAELLELPFERRLDPGATVREVDVHLRHAAVEIVVDPAAQPRLRARRRPPERSAKLPRRQPALEWSDQNGAITVSRAAGDSPPAIPIRVEIVVRAVDRLGLSGSDLDVAIREARPQEASIPDDGAPRRLDLRVERSTVDLEGVPGARLAVSGGRLRLRRTTGAVVIAASGECEVEVEGHEGDLRLAGDQADFRIARHRGDLSLELDDSRLVVADSESPLHGRLRGGWAQLEGWRGQGQLTGGDAVFEVLLAGAPETELTVEGRGLEVTVDHYEGAFTARLEGGTLRGAGLVGRTDVTLRAAAFLDLRELRGEVRLSLESGASARLADVAEKVVAVVRDARLETERVRDLNLLAERAEIVAGELLRLGRAKATDSRLDLDLTQLNHDPSLILKGASTAQVRLRTPCEVRLAEYGEITEERAKVSGCEFRMRSQASERLPWQTLVEGATKLVGSVSQESSLVVRGVTLP